MKFKIKPEVFQKFPNLVVAIPVILGFNNQKSGTEILKYLRQQEKDLTARMKPAALFKDPRVTSYFNLFRQFGADPEKIVPTHAALAKRVLEGGQIPDINPMVNLYNAVSLKYLTPFGGEDLDTLYGDFVLKFSPGGEQWIGIGAKKSKPTFKGDLVWGDDLDISTKSLNWRQCERTKLTSESKDDYFIMDGFSDVNRENIDQAAKEFIKLATEWCGGKTTMLWLDKNHPEAEVNFETKDIKSIKPVIVAKNVKPKTELVGLALVIKKAIVKVVGKDINFSVEHPENMSWGDFSTNVGIITGKAKEICARLKDEENLVKIASKIEVAGTGFINISIQPESLVTQTNQLLKEGIDKTMTGKKIMVEFAHPNTHKEMHIGHMRTLIVGESLSRILTAAGATVFRANYQGDIGPHVAKSIWGTEKILKEEKLNWDKAGKLNLSEKAHLLGRGYVRGNQDYEANQTEINQLNLKIYAHDKSVESIYQQTRKWSLDGYDSFYKRFKTKFDRLFFESEVAEKGKQIVLNNLGKVFKKSDGAVVFPGENYGLHTRVFVTQDGNPTYEAKDMGLAPAQLAAFPFDRCVHVVANEQTGYFQVIIKALELIDKKFIGRQYHLPMGMVSLVGRKISSRTGEIVTVDGLLEEIKELLKPLAKNNQALAAVTVGAVKYSVLKTGCRQDVAFDLKKSVSLDGNSGPYLQYTYARARSVLEKNGRIGSFHFDKLVPWQPEEEALLRTLYRFEEVVVQAAEQLAPNLVANFIYDLAQKFNGFYNQHRVIGDDFRLWLTFATAEIIKKGLNLLGIQASEKM